jgi:carbon-monoxide dehydrogenase large subunit
VNAVVDALSPLGVKHIEMPLTRAKVWHAIKDARAAASAPVTQNGATHI